MDNQEQKEIQNSAVNPSTRRIRNRLPAVLSGLFLLVLMLAVGFGYWDGTRQRALQDQKAMDEYLVGQYNLALGDIQAGRFDFAKQRLDEIVYRNPDYPGAKEAQQKVIRLMNATPTPIPTATTKPSPTPNVALGEQMIQKAQQQYKDKDFKGALLTLLSIQKDIPSYNPLRIEGLLFLSLQEEGLAEIKSLNLEAGIYHLWMASRYASLNATSIQKMDWAKEVLSAYQAAYHFRKVDLEKSVLNFSAAYFLAPSYRPSLAQDYTDTLNSYIKQLKGIGDDCYVQNKLDELIAKSQSDSIMIQQRDDAANRCNASRPPKPTSEPTAEGPIPTP